MSLYFGEQHLHLPVFKMMITSHHPIDLRIDYDYIAARFLPLHALSYELVGS